MVEREVVVVPEARLHARPAKDLVKKAKGYSSNITIVEDGREVNVKSPLKLMTLGAHQGDKLVIRATGDDEEAAVEALAELLSSEEE